MITASVLLMLLSFDTQDSPCVLTPQLELRRTNMPADIFHLFYAAKDSVDYGLAKRRGVPADLRHFDRINRTMLEECSRRWTLSYTKKNADYEIVAVAFKDRSVRYRATRQAIYQGSASGWIKIAEYCYF